MPLMLRVGEGVIDPVARDLTQDLMPDQVGPNFFAVNNIEGGCRNSQRQSICPLVRNKSPFTATIFHRTFPNF